MSLADRLRATAALLRGQADALEALARTECTDFVTRRTCGVSGRAWDAMVKAGLPVVRVGREKAARRADFVAALDRVEDRKTLVLRDEYEELLRGAGIVLAPR